MLSDLELDSLVPYNARLYIHIYTNEFLNTYMRAYTHMDIFLHAVCLYIHLRITVHLNVAFGCVFIKSDVLLFPMKLILNDNLLIN